MTMKDVEAITRRATGLAMLLAPAVWLLSTIVAPKLSSDELPQIAWIAREPDRWYWYALLTLIGAMLLVPALLGVMNLMRERAPLAGCIGGSLALLGTLVAIGDSTVQLVMWQMGAPGADPAQMAALLKRFDDATGSALIFTIGGLAVLAGTVVLAIGLTRARLAPAWAAACLPLGTVVNVAAYGAGSRTLLAVSYAILLAGFAPLAKTLLDVRQTAPAWRRPLTSAR
jgi:hypothetical protein